MSAPARPVTAALLVTVAACSSSDQSPEETVKPSQSQMQPTGTPTPPVRPARVSSQWRTVEGADFTIGVPGVFEEEIVTGLRDLESRRVTTVLPADTSTQWLYDEPELSPNGQQVAFSTDRGGGAVAAVARPARGEVQGSRSAGHRRDDRRVRHAARRGARTTSSRPA